MTDKSGHYAYLRKLPTVRIRQFYCEGQTRNDVFDALHFCYEIFRKQLKSLRRTFFHSSLAFHREAHFFVQFVQVKYQTQKAFKIVFVIFSTLKK